MKCKSLFSEIKIRKVLPEVVCRICPDSGKTEYLRIRFPMAVTIHRNFPGRLYDLDRSVSACVTLMK